MARQYEFDDDEPFVVIEKEQGTLSSFFVGLAIGAGLALLFAPRSGVETRREIKRRARSAERAARRVASDVTDTVTDKFHDARRRVEHRIDRTRQAIEMKKEQVQRAMEAGRAAAQEAREELERRIAETKAAYQAGGEVAHAPGRTTTTARVVSPAAAEADEEPEIT
jgi:gas vesicle protein